MLLERELLLSSIQSRIRAGRVLDAFEGAYATFEKLLVRLLLRGASDELADLEALALELQDEALAACARFWVAEFEFEGVIGFVLRHGSDALQMPERAWPAGKPEDHDLVRDMVREILEGLGVLRRRELGERLRRALAGLAGPDTEDRPGTVRVNELLRVARAGERIDPRSLRRPRPRGAPRRPELDGLCRYAARERLFLNGRTMRQAARRVVFLLDGAWKHERIYERIKHLAQAEVPVPKHWKKTLFAARMQPLHAVDVLRDVPRFQESTPT